MPPLFDSSASNTKKHILRATPALRGDLVEGADAPNLSGTGWTKCRSVCSPLRAVGRIDKRETERERRERREERGKRKERRENRERERDIYKIKEKTTLH